MSNENNGESLVPGEGAAAIGATKEATGTDIMSKRRQLKEKKKSKVFEIEQQKLEQNFVDSRENYERMKRLETEDHETYKQSLERANTVESQSDEAETIPTHIVAPSYTAQDSSTATPNLRKLQFENERLKEENENTSIRFVEMRNKAEVLDYQLSLMKEELAEANANVTTYNGRISQLNSNNKNLTLKANQLTKQVADLTDKLNTREKLIIENQLVGVYVANPDYDPPETQGNGELISAHAQEFIETYRGKKEEKFRDTFDHMIEELLSSKEKAAKFESDLESAMASLSKIQVIKEKMKLELEDHLKNEQEMHHQAMKDLKSARSKSMTLAADNEELTADIERMKIKLNGKEKLTEKMQITIEELRKENRELKNKLKN